MHLPGPKGNAKNARSELECLELFLDDTIIKIITDYRNIYIEEVKNILLRERDARLTDDIEIRAFFGILLLTGCLWVNRRNTNQVWENSRGSGVQSCCLAMNENRFHFLLRCLRFDDIRSGAFRRNLTVSCPSVKYLNYLF